MAVSERIFAAGITPEKNRQLSDCTYRPGMVVFELR